MIRKTIAASLHEAFKLQTEEEDTFKLRDTLKNLLEDHTKDTIEALC